MRRPKPIQKPVKALPQIGDFIVREAWDGKCGARVCLKTGPRWDDYEPMILCRTDHGAEKLAAFMNAAKDLDRNWHQIRDESPYQGTDPRLYVRNTIAYAVQRAIKGPRPESFHDFIMRLDEERCEGCKPTPCEAA